VASGDGCSNGVTAVSETAQTFIVPDEGFRLKVVSALADNTKTISFLNGTNTSGNPIYATETLTLNNAAPPTSTTVWNTLPIIQKQETAAAVELYSVINGTEELIGYYAPSETVPSYKRYSVGNYGDQTTANALCKLAYVPAVADTDLIFPPVLGALLHGLKGIQYELKSDSRDFEEWEKAKRILMNDREELDGKVFPVIEVVGDFGAGNTPNLIGGYGWGGYPGNQYGY